MELKNVQSELRRLLAIADRWQDKDDITPIERDLMLARLRAIYEALLFGPDELTVAKTEVATEEKADEPTEVVAGVAAAGVALAASEEAVQMPSFEAQTEESLEEQTEEEPFEEEQSVQRDEEPWVLDADDLLSFDVLDPIEEIPFREEEAYQEPTHPEIQQEENAPKEEATLEEEPPTVIEFNEQEEPVQEEESTEVKEELLEVKEIAENAQPVEKEDATQDAQPPLPEPAAQTEVVEEPSQRRVSTLFGEEDASVRHRHRQRVILSLYDTQPKELLPKQGEVIAVDVKPEVIEISDQELSSTRRVERRTVTSVPHRAEENRSDAIKREQTMAASEATLHTTEEPKVPVLGEVIKPVETLSDTIAPRPDVATQLHRQSAVTDLRRAVGVNDKYLLIRDLFGGNGSLYEITIRRLNAFETLDDCLIYIAKNFAWNPDSDGARLLMDVLERKFAE